MFRLGGSARKNFSNGSFSEDTRGKSIAELLDMQASSADKSLAGLDSMRDL